MQPSGTEQTLLTTIPDIQATVLLSQRTDGAIEGNRWR